MYQKYIKRILDVIFSMILLIVTSPFLVIFAIAIKLEDLGPIFFVQERTGKNGINFNIYKFRTMTVETEKNGKKLTHDERLTKVGKIARRLSIDEVLQAINILKGEMSFIGPRPWIPEYYNSFSEEQKKRVDVFPGITGLAQTKVKNKTDVFEKIKYDIEYTKNISFKTDFKILIDTFMVIFNTSKDDIKQEEIEEEINMLKLQ